MVSARPIAWRTTGFGGQIVDHSRIVPPALSVVATVLLLAVPYPGNLLLLAAAAGFIIALVAPPVGLGLLVVSVPLQSLVEIQVGSVRLGLSDALFAAVVAAWVMRLPARRPGFRCRVVGLCFAAYALVAALSVVNAESIPSWSTEFYRWWGPLVVFMVAADTLREPRSAQPVIVGTAAGTVGASLVGCYQVAADLGPSSFAVGGVTRAFATFGHPNPFAGYLGVTVPLLGAVAAGWLVPVVRPELARVFGRAVVVAAGTASLVGLTALVLTQSRGGWLGGAAGLAAVVWLMGGHVRWTAVALAGATTALALATPAGGLVAERVASGTVSLRPEVQVTTENFAVRERLAHWRAGLTMARQHPWLGVGAGNFSRHYRETTPEWRFRISRGHAHNAYIHAAAQTGLVGLAAYLALAAAVGGTLFRALRRAEGVAARTLVVGVAGVSLSFATHNMVDYMHVPGIGLQLSAIWALALVQDGRDHGRRVPAAVPSTMQPS